jgi:hypothetical protein
MTSLDSTLNNVKRQKMAKNQGSGLLLLAAFLVAFATPYGTLSATNAFADTSSGQTVGITIMSADVNTNNPIYGYYVVLMQNGQVINTGFTTTTFSVVTGQTYQILAENYGSCIFYDWTDGIHNKEVFQNPFTFVAQSYSAYLGANYKCGNSGVGGGGASGSQVTVNSQDMNGNTISGYYTILYQNGAAINTGFTPATFQTTAGQQYTVQVQDYGSYYFNHWSDGTTSRDKTFTATSSGQTFTAVYSTSPSSSSGGSSSANGGSGGSGGSSSSGTGVTVASVDQNGNPIYGYYTLLCTQGTSLNSDGSTSCDNNGSSFLGSGFTTVTFNSGLVQGQTYGVEVQDYGNCHFNHWTDNPSNVGYTYRFHLFNASNPPNKLTAVYGCS